MQKRSHKLLAATLLENTQGFQARRFELAFLFGSFQPDCNPLTYLKGSLRAYKFRGHNYSNSQHYIYSRISRLQRRQRWTIWQYYTLGKLTHYLADAFTYPHNENYPDSMLCHHQYETDLRAYLEEYQEDTAELDVFLPVRQERLAEAMDDRNRLLALLAYLTPKERQVVHLQADGYTYHEIAEICNITSHGVHSRFYRLRRKVRSLDGMEV